MAGYLVTGAAGFIGANLVARLKDKGHWVRAVDVKETPEREHLYRRADQAWTTCDLRHEAWATSAVRDMDFVYHLAADHGGAGYFHGPADFKAAMNNEAIDRNVLRAAMANKVSRLFFASSACTYPTTIQGKGAKALSESDWGGGPAEALYGERKRMSTLFFEGAREHGLDARSGIFHTIYGPTQDTEEPRAKFPTAICRKILAYRDHRRVQSGSGVPEGVEVWGDGTQVRTFLYIDDALDKIEAVMERPYAGPVNIGSDEEVTVAECCEWAAEAAGVEPTWLYDTDQPTGVEHRSSDNTAYVTRYGLLDLTPAREGFRRLLEWMDADRK